MLDSDWLFLRPSVVLDSDWLFFRSSGVLDSDWLFLRPSVVLGSDWLFFRSSGVADSDWLFLRPSVVVDSDWFFFFFPRLSFFLLGLLRLLRVLKTVSFCPVVEQNTSRLAEGQGCIAAKSIVGKKKKKLGEGWDKKLHWLSESRHSITTTTTTAITTLMLSHDKASKVLFTLNLSQPATPKWRHPHQEHRRFH